MPGTPSGLSRNGAPLELWGIKAQSAGVRDEYTDELVCHLDEYASYGINALVVFYQGSSGGTAQAFSDDGRTLEAGTERRMRHLVEAAGQRGMVVIAGIFYQRARLGSRAAYLRAAEQVGSALARYDNVIVDVANEHNSRRWEGCPFPIQTADGTAELCLAVKAGAPTLLVGGGGVHPGVNAEVVTRREIDLLLFDSTRTCAEAVPVYRAAETDKPLINIELFAASAQGFAEVDDTGALSWPGWPGGEPAPLPPERRRVQGVYPAAGTEGGHRGKQDVLDEIAYAAATPGFSVCFHAPGWFQGLSRGNGLRNRFDLGGQGTLDDPGIRWYCEAVARTRSYSAHAPSGATREE